MGCFLANVMFRMLVSYGEGSVLASNDDQWEEERQVTKPTSSCELRVYEWMSDECWKTTRRLVLSSSPNISDPWCISYCELMLEMSAGDYSQCLHEA